MTTAKIVTISVAMRMSGPLFTSGGGGGIVPVEAMMQESVEFSVRFVGDSRGFSGSPMFLRQA